MIPTEVKFRNTSLDFQMSAKYYQNHYILSESFLEDSTCKPVTKFLGNFLGQALREAVL